jgi:hypothetical protein
MRDVTRTSSVFVPAPKSMRRLFTPEEDALLAHVMNECQFSSWVDVARHIPGRSARQCRDRWSNYLCPVNKNGPWLRSEDLLLAQKVAELGPRWARIARFFDGRSENNVKNRWYTRIKAAAEREDDLMTNHVPHYSTITKTLFPPISTLEARVPGAFGWGDSGSDPDSARR